MPYGLCSVTITVFYAPKIYFVNWLISGVKSSSFTMSKPAINSASLLSWLLDPSLICWSIFWTWDSPIIFNPVITNLKSKCGVFYCNSSTISLMILSSSMKGTGSLLSSKSIPEMCLYSTMKTFYSMHLCSAHLVNSLKNGMYLPSSPTFVNLC